MWNWNESAWFAMLTGAALKSTIVLGAAWLLARAMRRQSAAARHLVWTAAAAALLALPVLSLSLPALRVRGGALRAFVPSITFHVTATAKDPHPSDSKSKAAAATPTAPRSAPWQPDYRFWLPVVWAAGTLIGLGQMALAGITMRRLRRVSAAPADSHFFFGLAYAFDIHDRVELIESPAGTMPMNFGILRPTVFLPANAARWSEDRRRMVLLHELAHVRRGDVATNLLMRGALCLYWWNPLAWTAWRESIKERERAADDMVLAAGEAASGYAGHLLDIARSMQSSTPLAWAAIAMARPSQLEGRLLAILDSRVPRNTPGPRAAIAAAFLAVALVAPFAAVQAQDKLDPVTAPVVEATIKAAAAQNNQDITDAAAAAFTSTNRYEAAQKLLEKSLTIRAQNSGEASSAYAIGLMKLGDLSAKRGKTSDAVDFYTRAVALGDTADTAGGLAYLAGQAYAAGDLSRADGLADRALAAVPAGAVAGRALTVKADVALKNGLAGVAETEYLHALTEEPSDSQDAALTTRKYAMLLNTQNRTVEAQALLTRARLLHFDTAASTASPLPNGVYRVGSGISAPVLLSKIEPEYTEEARAAKLQGTVMLYVQIAPDGTANNIQVTKSLGLGLDEKAIETVTKWKFQPGMKNGAPVTVEATIEVNFRLL